MDYVLETNALTKKYKNFKALDRLTMKIPQGSIYGLVGKNGAGKTTLIRIICGLQNPTSGEFSLYGEKNSTKRITKARQRIGAVVETPSIYLDMTAYDNVKQQYITLGIPSYDDIKDLLTLVGLENTGRKKAKNFSLGMKQRLGVALALLGNPDLLILDEPINGLDPEGIRELRQLIQRLHEEGKTILLSSHILGELSKIATNYGIIKDGELVEQVSREELEEKCQDYFQIEVQEVQRAFALIRESFPDVRAEAADSSSIRLYGVRNGAEVNQMLIENQVSVYASGFHHMDLEEYFLDRMEGGRRYV